MPPACIALTTFLFPLATIASPSEPLHDPFSTRPCSHSVCDVCFDRTPSRLVTTCLFDFPLLQDSQYDFIPVQYVVVCIDIRSPLMLVASWIAADQTTFLTIKSLLYDNHPFCPVSRCYAWCSPYSGVAYSHLPVNGPPIHCCLHPDRAYAGRTLGQWHYLSPFPSHSLFPSKYQNYVFQSFFGHSHSLLSLRRE